MYILGSVPRKGLMGTNIYTGKGRSVRSMESVGPRTWETMFEVLSVGEMGSKGPFILCRRKPDPSRRKMMPFCYVEERAADNFENLKKKGSEPGIQTRKT